MCQLIGLWIRIPKQGRDVLWKHPMLYRKRTTEVHALSVDITLPTSACTSVQTAETARTADERRI